MRYGHLWRLGLLSCVLVLPVSAAEPSPVLTELAFREASFAPSRGERAHIRYRLNASAPITLRVSDPDGGLVTVLTNNVVQDAGEHEVEWNGRDLDDKVVPDEAYQAVVETGGARVESAASVPTRAGDITDARFDQEAGTLVYQLPAPSRVLIRCGLQNGPMLRTLVDWKVRVAGSITEYWDGRDEDHLEVISRNKDFRALITYVPLPAATVIAYGNDGESYRDFKLGRGKKRPTTSVQGDGDKKLQVPRGLVPPAWTRAPRVEVTFPRAKGETARPVELRDRADVRVDVDASDREQLLGEQFEVIFFVDHVFFGEAERGYLPMTWPWETQQLPPGEHTLTVNVSSFGGQVGVASRKVRIVRPGS